jgi:hypothetical protein
VAVKTELDRNGARVCLDANLDGIKITNHISGLTTIYIATKPNHESMINKGNLLLVILSITHNKK